jgi:hypothetical protein
MVSGDIDASAKGGLSQGSESWASKLQDVTASLVINLIQMHLGYQGKRFTFDSDENCKEVLRRLLTPAWQSGQEKYRRFPIEEKSLLE